MILPKRHIRPKFLRLIKLALFISQNKQTPSHRPILATLYRGRYYKVVFLNLMYTNEFCIFWQPMANSSFCSVFLQWRSHQELLFNLTRWQTMTHSELREFSCFFNSRGAKNFIITSHPPIKLASCVIRATPAARKRNEEAVEFHTHALSFSASRHLMEIKGTTWKVLKAEGACRPVPIYFYHADFFAWAAIHLDGDWAGRVSPHDPVIHFPTLYIYT